MLSIYKYTTVLPAVVHLFDFPANWKMMAKTTTGIPKNRREKKNLPRLKQIVSLNVTINEKTMSDSSLIKQLYTWTPISR